MTNINVIIIVVLWALIGIIGIGCNMSNKSYGCCNGWFLIFLLAAPFLALITKFV